MIVERRAGAGLEAAAVGTVAAAGVAVTRLRPLPAILAGLGAAGMLVLLARRAGAGWDELGLHRWGLAPGFRWGLAASLPMAVATAAAAAFPPTRRLFAERKAVVAPRPEFLAHVLFRVPLATALTEEVLFRAGLPAVLRRRRGREGAELASAALFGLWHILPTLQELGARRARRPVSRGDRVAAASIAVMTTFAAARAFAWLRDRSGSLVAPVLAHAVINEASLLGGRAAARRLGLLGPR
ncbi:MAG: CPBP family intramembrane glutamic endopeptidase [Actinomycetota bacterium]